MPTQSTATVVQTTTSSADAGARRRRPSARYTASVISNTRCSAAKDPASPLRDDHHHSPHSGSASPRDDAMPPCPNARRPVPPLKSTPTPRPHGRVEPEHRVPEAPAVHFRHHLDRCAARATAGRTRAAIRRTRPARARDRACRPRARPWRCAKARCARSRCGTAPCSARRRRRRPASCARSTPPARCGRRARACVSRGMPEDVESSRAGVRISSRTYVLDRTAVDRFDDRAEHLPARHRVVARGGARLPHRRRARRCERSRRRRRSSSSKARVAVHREPAGVGEHVADRAALLAAAPAVDVVADAVVEAEAPLLPERSTATVVTGLPEEYQSMTSSVASGRPGRALADGHVEQRPHRRPTRSTGRSRGGRRPVGARGSRAPANTSCDLGQVWVRTMPKPKRETQRARQARQLMASTSTELKEEPSQPTDPVGAPTHRSLRVALLGRRVDEPGRQLRGPAAAPPPTDSPAAASPRPSPHLRRHPAPAPDGRPRA